MAVTPRSDPQTIAGHTPAPPLREIVVCALDAWDDVWIRNQPLADALLRLRPDVRILFIEPPTDPIHNLARGRLPVGLRMSSLRADGRLVVVRPLKLLPRRLGPMSDELLFRQVAYAARRVGFVHPTLWLNDVTYAPLIRRTGWPTVYEVSDDWLLAPFPARQIARLRDLDAVALALADEVVVCSAALMTSRGRARPVTLVPNAVDIEMFRRPRDRPRDLPPGPTAVYVGTLHDARLDVSLVVELARSLRRLSLVLVGPNVLSSATSQTLAREPNIYLLGSRPHVDVPAYLQHADVVFVPHRITPFTESLDPVKAYECLAVATPAVATAVAGFRDLAESVTVVPRESFVGAVHAAVRGETRQARSTRIPTWDDRAVVFFDVLTRAADHAADQATRERAGSEDDATRIARLPDLD
jgi:glycosyltransferase involved in cell wall biosynthesis